jgi:hypothetical protein
MIELLAFVKTAEMSKTLLESTLGKRTIAAYMYIPLTL